MTLDPVAYRPYQDPDDFIREVTDRIWVQRDIAYIEDNYEPDSIVHGGLGTTVGRQGVIQGSLMRIAATPYRVGQAEDVIWEARGDDAFLSSHLVLSATRAVVDGHPTALRSRTIANCLYRSGRMVEEWVARDTLAGVRQRRLDPDEVARSFAFQGYTGSWLDEPPADVLAVGDSGARPDDHRGECELVLEFLQEVWSQRKLNRVAEFTERDLTLLDVGDVTLVRPDAYQRSILDLVSCFPDATFAVRDVQTHDDARYAGLRVAVLWQMKGTHSGALHYGPLTNQPIDLMGISQFLIQRGRIVREVRIYDDIALRAQIGSLRGDDATTISSNIY